MGHLKNLLVYISPTKTFSEECTTLARIQIHNSLQLDWKKEDIVLVTNFPYKRHGIQAIVVGDEHYYAKRPRSIKTAIIPYLIDQNIIKKDNIYWNHDFDAHQLNVFDERELKLDNVDVGLTDYGWKKRWCMGSFFVKASAKDIFEEARSLIYQDMEDETAMGQLTKNERIKKRTKRLNVTYNFGMRYVESNYQNAVKPLKVLHFHPKYKTVYLTPKYRWEWTWDVFVNGKNGLNMPLINKRLLKIFNHHGIT